jgi:hypothetical protein
VLLVCEAREGKLLLPAARLEAIICANVDTESDGLEVQGRVRSIYKEAEILTRPVLSERKSSITSVNLRFLGRR